MHMEDITDNRESPQLLGKYLNILKKAEACEGDLGAAGAQQ